MKLKFRYIKPDKKTDFIPILEEFEGTMKEFEEITKRVNFVRENE